MQKAAELGTKDASLLVHSLKAINTDVSNEDTVGPAAEAASLIAKIQDVSNLLQCHFRADNELSFVLKQGNSPVPGSIGDKDVYVPEPLIPVFGAWVSTQLSNVIESDYGFTWLSDAVGCATGTVSGDQSQMQAVLCALPGSEWYKEHLTTVTTVRPTSFFMGCHKKCSAQLQAWGGNAPYTWKTTSSLPSGVSLSSGGTLSAPAPGLLDKTYTVHVDVEDSSWPKEETSVTVVVTFGLWLPIIL